MALRYATDADLQAYLAPEPTPANAGTLLAMASRLVRAATRSCVYAANPAGAPEDTDLSDAFRDATVAQAAYWIRNGVDPTKGAGAIYGAVKGASLLSASYQQTDPGKAAEAVAASLSGLVGEAESIVSAVLSEYGEQPYQTYSGRWLP